MIAKITRAYIRHYTDNNQKTAYVEWIDRRGRAGRIEGNLGGRKIRSLFNEPHEANCNWSKGDPCSCGQPNALGQHMKALFDRAEREGVSIEHETW